MSKFLTDSKRSCVKWAVAWGSVGLVGLIGLILLQTAIPWPLSIKVLVAVVLGWMIGMGVGQPIVALIEYRTDFKLDVRMKSLHL